MLFGIMSIVYSILSNKYNPHLVYGRGIAGILIALGWALWTYSVIYADYRFFFNLGNMLQSNTIYNLILIEFGQIIITILTALHLLGHEFKWLKRSK